MLGSAIEKPCVCAVDAIYAVDVPLAYRKLIAHSDLQTYLARIMHKQS